MLSRHALSSILKKVPRGEQLSTSQLTLTFLTPLRLVDQERLDWLAHAETIQCLEDATHWEEVASYSRRTHQQSPIGGLIGTATFAGDLAPFREILTWEN